MNKNVKLTRYNKNLLEKIWKIGFMEAKPEWKIWDGPYFDNDYQKYDTFEEFNKSESSFYLRDNIMCILYNNEPVGTVVRYWEDEKTRWLNIGITIYSSNAWGKGIGYKALKLWITQIFNDIKNLEHIGLTTWSGNLRMIRLSEKLGMKKEAQIRKVRYHNGFYYDSISYGVLRDEWNNLKE